MSGSENSGSYWDYLTKLGELALNKAENAVKDFKYFHLTPEQDQAAFDTGVLLNILNNFLTYHKESKDYNEIRYYMGLLLKKHFKNENRNTTDKEALANMDEKFVLETLKAFAAAHNNKKNGVAGVGAEAFILAVLDPRNTDAETLLTKKIEFDQKYYTKKTPFDKDEINRYIEEKLTLTSKEVAEMRIKHAWNTPLKMLRGLDNIFSMALKKTLILMVDVSFKYAPDHTAGYIIKNASKDTLGQQGGGFAHALVQGGLNFAESTGLMPDARKQLNARVKEETHNVINKLDARPSMLAINTARKSKEQAKWLGIKAKKVKKIVEKKVKPRKPKH